MGGEVSAMAGIGNAVLGTLWLLAAGVIALVAVTVAFCGLMVFLGWRIDRKSRRTPTQPSPVLGDHAIGMIRRAREEDRREADTIAAMEAEWNRQQGGGRD